MSRDASPATIIGFVNAAHFIDHMLMLVFATAVLGMTEPFGRSYAEMLPLSIGAFVAFGAGSIPAGWLGDLWSRRNMMAVFFIGIGLSAIATSFSNGPVELAVCLTAIGLFASIYHPVGTAVLVSQAEKVGRSLGLNGVFGNLGVAFAALITGALVQWLGWRIAFLVPGAIAVQIGLLFIWLVPDTGSIRKPQASQGAAVPQSVMIRAFAVLMVATAVGGLVFNAATVSLPKLLQERAGFLGTTPMLIGLMASLIYMFGAVAQLIVGRLLDRMPLKTVYVPLSALQAPCLLFAAMTEDWLVVSLTMLIMFAIFGQVTVNDTMVARYTRDQWRARAYAVRYFVSFGASALAVPLIALLHGRFGNLTATYQVLAALGLIIFLGSLAFPLRREELVSR